MNRFDENLEIPIRSDLGRKFFTLDQADRALILVRRIVTDIVDQYARLNELQEIIESAQRSGRYDRARQTQEELLRSVQRVQSCVEELDVVGVDLRDWTLGVVDFPSIVEGREIAFCWQFGQSEIAYWHGVDRQCHDRQPIETLFVEETLAAQNP